MADIKPYIISIPGSAIEDLKTRLSLVRFPDELSNADWEMGAPLSDMKRLTTYWKDTYDWRKAEAELNKLPQFVTNIQCDGFESLAIHFIHLKSNVKNAIPLLFIHGWPGHYQEVIKILEPLTKGGDGKDIPAFDVVAPSLPNFGFSEGTKKRGFGLEQYSETCNKLMLKLGYNEYVTQGGDWGCHISRAMDHLYPQHVRASHINMDSVDPPTWAKNPLLALQYNLTPETEREKQGRERRDWFVNEGRGYNLEQSTRPQTIGYALADSPTACLAWIYEKLHDWTDSYPWTDEEVCTWVSTYWFSTAGPAASVRIYYEFNHNVDGRENKCDVKRIRSYSPGVKLGFSHFPRDLAIFPHSWFGTLGEVVFHSDRPDGGHFAAWERPKELVEDVRAMFGRGGGAFGVVEGKNGYVA